MQTTWVLVADSSRARIFEKQGAQRPLLEIEDFANPQGRAENRELNRDAYGRFYGKGGRGQGYIATPHVEAVQHETELFSQALGDYIDKARVAHRYDKLCLIAPPKFLGLIRQNLSEEAQKLVGEEIPKDVSWFDAKDVENYFEDTKH